MRFLQLLLRTSKSSLKRFSHFRLLFGPQHHPLLIWPCCLKISMQRRCQRLHFYFDGEELTVKTAQKLLQRFPEARIINAYGPTEATVALSAVAVTDEMLANLKRLPIGYTKEDSPTYIIDERTEISFQMVNRVKSSYQDQQFQKDI